MSISISIIIPTLNEEKYLARTIEHIYAHAEAEKHLEILVIDAGSVDRTLESINDFEIKTFSREEFIGKKYASLNFGLQQSTGEVVLFLDADTLLPKGFDTQIHKKFQQTGVVGGAFEFSFIHPDWKLKVVELLNRIRYRFGQLYYGDQAVFCLRNVAIEVGGFPEKELMESAFFCKRLLKAGKLRLIKSPVKTSPRRFNESGFFKVTWFDISMWIRFVFNFPVEQYGKQYWKMNVKSDG